MKHHLEPIEIVSYSNGNKSYKADLVSVEEPLGIRLVYGPVSDCQTKDLSITMRTPGEDISLALGFLYTEGILKTPESVMSVEVSEQEEDTWVTVTVVESLSVDLERLERHFYTTSSCGVCGKASIDAVKIACPLIVPQKKWQISPEILLQLPDNLRKSQNNFEFSGGIHACGLFDLEGNLLSLKEDVGRHNALDKLIGAAFQQREIPLFDHILVLSGRASFELVQKASMAGIRFIAAIGAPSSLAVSLAESLDITLVGFLKSHRFNVYSGESRIRL